MDFTQKYNNVQSHSLTKFQQNYNLFSLKNLDFTEKYNIVQSNASSILIHYCKQVLCHIPDICVHNKHGFVIFAELF